MSRRPRKVNWNRDLMAEYIREVSDGSWRRTLVRAHADPRVRKVFNDKMRVYRIEAGEQHG